jgi:DNA repair exonuclease SbcCD nuclease subunit
MVIISGNHDTPKQRAVGSVLSFFDVFSPYLHLVYKNEYELIRLDETAIHSIPHCLNQEDFSKELTKVTINPQDKYNILMLHGVVAGIPEFSMGELSEQEIPTSYLEKGFDYVALGHYHKFCQVESGGYYSGSTERLSMAELGQKKGFVEVNLDTTDVKFHPVPTRDMIELSSIYARDLDQERILSVIESRIAEEDITEKIVRLKVKSIPKHIYNSLDFRRINEIKSKAFYFDLKLERPKDKDDKDQQSTESIGRLNIEFDQFLKQVPVENLMKEKLLELGLRYLSIKTTEDEEAKDL